MTQPPDPHAVLLDTISTALNAAGYWLPIDGKKAVADAVLKTGNTGTHDYLSTGCLHGDTVLPDGRTGHQYCQGHTGQAGAKQPAQCKFCSAPCRCACHTTA
ncbi:hypothetical protein [Streptomyces sp. NPDC004330]|uniref:hypothetical protein n=1 Tax=Streptomyces sp. NPDC004330 TaxID=3364700 RepID=UPI0036CD777E